MESYEPVIPKAELVHGAYYKGRCRNATEARWHEKDQCFYHWRYKFGWFIETIKAPEDDKVYDVFIAEERIETPEKEIQLPGEADGKKGIITSGE